MSVPDPRFRFVTRAYRLLLRAFPRAYARRTRPSWSSSSSSATPRSARVVVPRVCAAPHVAVAVGMGLAAGLAAAIAGGRLIRRLLFGERARDPLTLVAVTLVLALVAALACVAPAPRAATVHPADAIRT